MIQPELKGHRQFRFARINTWIACAFFIFFLPANAISPEEVRDIKAAKELCDALPLSAPEGIWIYPEDNVTVLITRYASVKPSSHTVYEIRIISSTDAQLKPGELLGTLQQTVTPGQYRMLLNTTRKNGILTTPRECSATLTADHEGMAVEKQQSKFNLRFTLSPTVLLPSFWKIIRISAGSAKTHNLVKEGMMRIYPSYDGNGSSRRKPRYL